MIYIRLVITMAIVLWQHRGGRKCGPDCRCEDHF